MMKRVLQIMGGLKRGGLETFSMNMYRSIDRNKIQFDFLLTKVTDGDYEEEAKSMGANIFHIPARNKGYKAYRQALDDFFRKHHNYVAIHFHISSLSSIEPAYYAKKYGIPIRIFHSHSSSIQRSFRLHWVHMFLHYMNKPKVSTYATHYLGCSDKAIDWIYKYTGVRSKAKIVNNGIDCEQYRFNETIRSEVRKEFNIGEDDFVIGHVGRFIPLKNQGFIIDILEELHKKMSAVKVLFVGDGDTMEEVKIKVKSKGLMDFVIFTGVRSDVSRLMQAMDIFVMPSFFEGLPVSLVEAQSSGLPIIASDTISHDSDLSGTILFKSIHDSAAEWAKCIPEWKKKLGRPNNIEKIKSAGFDSSTSAKQIMEIYTNFAQ